MAHLETLGVDARFEPYKLPWRDLPVEPEDHKYTPDIILRNGIVIETKGRFAWADQQKHLALKEQHPEIDLRFVFSRSTSGIMSKDRKTLKTTCAAWCRKHGFQFAERLIPTEWAFEPPNPVRIAALKAVRIL